MIFVRQVHAKWPLRVRLEKLFPFQRAYSRLLAPQFKNRRPWADRRRDHFSSACEESRPRCPSAFCADSCALGDECAERVCSARSRRYARLCRACSNRNAPSCQAFCSQVIGGDSLADPIHQRTSSQLYGRAARTASLKTAKLEAVPHVP